VYETRPCLPIDTVTLGSAGGRLAELDRNILLLSVGDHRAIGWDGTSWHPEQVLPQAAHADYGKTLRLDVATGAAETYTLGHRNPQGLHRGADGRIWLTEHGMSGGDELNLIERPANYGWPLVTLGRDYGYRTWGIHRAPGRHDGYAPPAFAWLPSIGISALTSVQGTRLAAWRGDLLVGSLRARALFRVRTIGDRVMFAERVCHDAGGRIRDLTEMMDGRIALSLDGGAVVLLDAVVSPAPAEGALGTAHMPAGARAANVPPASR
jgi:glucose/arabinose dehydrogenase